MFEGLINVGTSNEEVEEQIKKEYVEAYRKIETVYVHLEKLLENYKSNEKNEDVFFEVAKMLEFEGMRAEQEKAVKMKKIEKKFNVCFRSEQKGLVSSSSNYAYNDGLIMSLSSNYIYKGSFIKGLISNRKNRNKTKVHFEIKEKYELKIIKIKNSMFTLIGKMDLKQKEYEKLIIERIDTLVKNYSDIAELQIILMTKNH